MLAKRLIITSLILCFPALATQAFAETTCPSFQVCFTPGQPCASVILDAIHNAKKNIYLQAFSFTSMPIAEALGAAVKRGVKVEVQLDMAWHEEDKNNRAVIKLYSSGVKIWIDREIIKSHSKIMLIDKRKVFTGSYNFSQSAEKDNAENLVIIDNAYLAQKYFVNWKKRLKVSMLMPDFDPTDKIDYMLFKQKMLDLDEHLTTSENDTP
jgi:phosphatidylserine/phosphatidylglycerophosphate/cardiolipin synthase-like enzyme